MLTSNFSSSFLPKGVTYEKVKSFKPIKSDQKFMKDNKNVRFIGA